MNKSLKDIRKNSGLTQVEAAKLLGISRRTYINYESGASSLSEVKENVYKEMLHSATKIDETHGILTLKQIKDACSNVFKDFDVKYCILFGSYAKNKAKPTSDVDLLIEGNIDGLKYFEFLELLRERLKKNVDVLDKAQLLKNEVLLNDILKDGIKIYG